MDVRDKTCLKTTTVKVYIVIEEIVMQYERYSTFLSLYECIYIVILGDLLFRLRTARQTFQNKVKKRGSGCLKHLVSFK